MAKAETKTATTCQLTGKAIDLLQALIAIPSFSREEHATAQLLQQFLTKQGAHVKRSGNNVWASNHHFDPQKPTILLQSHHDTVKPNSGYTRNPFSPTVEDGKLYGLGSNDAGGCLVSLAATFLYFHEREDLAYNLIFAASAEEEISGPGGITALLPELGPIDCAIIGEPTQMDMAVAERGLMVLDCVTKGRSGHAARDEGENAFYKALPDIDWFRSYRFPKTSELLGACSMNVTVINAGNQHNVIPDRCSFTVDVRVNDCYTLDEILEIIQTNVDCEVRPRSMRLRSTRIDQEHPLVVAGSTLGKSSFGSATISDKALVPFPALKIGPGDSARSHTADEFIFLEEIERGIDDYIKLLEQVL